jgi:hypothetical protein
MKFLTVLFYDDGTYAGTQGNERPLPDDWSPPLYTKPGDAAPRRFLAVHLGVAEMPGNGRCVSTDLGEVLETHPKSTPEAPKFGIKSMAMMPQIHDAPVTLKDFPRWMRANGPAAMPKALRAWLTLTQPELAAAYRLDRGITIDDQMEVEAKRALLREEHSRLPALKVLAERQAAQRRQRLFERSRRGRARAADGEAAGE